MSNTNKTDLPPETVAILRAIAQIQIDAAVRRIRARREGPEALNRPAKFCL